MVNMVNMNIRECLYMCKIRFPCLRRFHLRQLPRLNLHICCHSLIACTYPCPSNHLPCNCKEESGSSTTVTTGSWRQSYHSLRAKVWTVNLLAACLDELHVLALRPIKGFFFARFQEHEDVKVHTYSKWEDFLHSVPRHTFCSLNGVTNVNSSPVYIC